MSLHLGRDPLQSALGAATLLGGMAAMVRAILRPTGNRRTAARRVAGIILGSGLLLLGLDLSLPGVPDTVRLPLVVGSLACVTTALVLLRADRRSGA